MSDASLSHDCNRYYPGIIDHTVESKAMAIGFRQEMAAVKFEVRQLAADFAIPLTTKKGKIVYCPMRGCAITKTFTRNGVDYHAAIALGLPKAEALRRAQILKANPKLRPIGADSLN